MTESRALVHPVKHRLEAVRILSRVLTDGSLIDDAIEEIMTKTPGLSRFWLLEVCSGVLRWKGRLDPLIDSLALSKKPTGFTRKLLYLGVYQVVVQDRAPISRVVSETVEAAKQKEGEGLARFINACLRKVSGLRDEWRKFPFVEEAPAGKKREAAWASMPLWMWDRIVKERGLEWARAYAEASLERPSIWLRSTDPHFESPNLEPGPIAGSFRVKEGVGENPYSGAIPEWPGFSQGKFFVQDLSSQKLVADLSKKVKSILGSDIKVLDLCSAPGGKAAGLSLNGFTVFATDQDNGRMELLKQTVERVAPFVRVIPRADLDALGEWDWVWVDAPCTGSGILRRHPEIRWIKEEKDLESLAEVQIKLVREAFGRVKSGGVFSYSVCSIFKEEGMGILDRSGIFKNPFELLGEWDLAPHTPTDHPLGGDGFYALLIRKK